MYHYPGVTERWLVLDNPLREDYVRQRHYEGERGDERPQERGVEYKLRPYEHNRNRQGEEIERSVEPAREDLSFQIERHDAGRLDYRAQDDRIESHLRARPAVRPDEAHVEDRRDEVEKGGNPV